MAEKPPESAHSEFLAYFRARDLDGMMSLYDEDATFVDFDGSVVRGKAVIRAAFASMFQQIGADAEISLDTRYAVPSGDIALLSNTWRITGTAADGAPLDMTGQTTEVVRKDGRGGWLYVIDHPFGGQ